MRVPLCVLLLVIAPIGTATGVAPGVGSSVIGSGPLDTTHTEPLDTTHTEPLDTTHTERIRSTRTTRGESPQVTNGSQAENRTAPSVSRVLAFPPGATRNSTIRTVRVDAGGATGLDARLAGVRMETEAIERRIEGVSLSERPTAIRQEADRLRDAERRLREQQEDTLTAFATGEMTARETVLALARIHATAGALRDRARVLASLAESSGVNESVVTDIETVELNLRSMQGPVRDRVLASVRGNEPQVRTFLATTQEGVVLSMIDGEEFVREAYLGRLWGDAGEPQSAAAASEIVSNSYPEIWAARNSSAVVGGPGFGSTFLFRVEHAGGELTTFVRRNEEVARAIQRIPLSAVPNGTVTERTALGVRVVVNRTYPGGPMRVAVFDAETGTPLNAEVTISVDGTGGERIGRTGRDGQLWTLSPGVTFTITADAGEASIAQFTVSPTDPATVGDAQQSRLTAAGGVESARVPAADITGQPTASADDEARVVGGTVDPFRARAAPARR